VSAADPLRRAARQAVRDLAIGAVRRLRVDQAHAWEARDLWHYAAAGAGIGVAQAVCRWFDDDGDDDDGDGGIPLDAREQAN